METKNNTKTIEILCYANVIVPDNFDDLTVEEKVEILRENIYREKIESYEIAYVPDYLEDQLDY